MNRQWWELTRLVTIREIRERARARSFWVASAILLIGVAVGAIIPAVNHGSHPTARVGIVGGPVAALSQTAREAGRISGTTVAVVQLPDVAAARSRLRSGSLDAVLVGDTEVLVKHQQALGTSSPGATLAGALAQIGGLQKLYAQLPRSVASRHRRS